MPWIPSHARMGPSAGTPGDVGAAFLMVRLQSGVPARRAALLRRWNAAGAPIGNVHRVGTLRSRSRRIRYGRCALRASRISQTSRSSPPPPCNCTSPSMSAGRSRWSTGGVRMAYCAIPRGVPLQRSVRDVRRPGWGQPNNGVAPSGGPACPSPGGTCRRQRRRPEDLEPCHPGSPNGRPRRLAAALPRYRLGPLRPRAGGLQPERQRRAAGCCRAG
jgi:hypothetical protein